MPSHLEEAIACRETQQLQLQVPPKNGRNGVRWYCGWLRKSYTHWIGFRENLQGSPLFFNGKIYGFLKIVPSTNPLMHKMVATGNYETLWNTVNNVIINLDKPSTSCRISQPSSVSDFGFYGETWGELMGVETWLHGIFSVWLCNTKKTDNLCRQMAHLSVFNSHFMEFW